MIRLNILFSLDLQKKKTQKHKLAAVSSGLIFTITEKPDKRKFVQEQTDLHTVFVIGENELNIKLLEFSLLTTIHNFFNQKL
jgi:hypothetical protein